MALRSVSTIVCSNSFTVCINIDQNVVSFGSSCYRAHGHDEEDVFPPKIIPTLNHIISISAGIEHSVCLDNDGNVFTFGGNYNGQLGIGNEDLAQSLFPDKVIFLLVHKFLVVMILQCVWMKMVKFILLVIM